jgi:hypothetical protein
MGDKVERDLNAEERPKQLASKNLLKIIFLLQALKQTLAMIVKKGKGSIDHI